MTDSTAVALRQSEARFRAGIEAVSDIIWTNDAQGMMVGAQVGWENFTGQDRASYQGYGWSSALHPDDVLPTINSWNAAVAAKKQFVFQHRVRRRDGQWRLCSVRAAPVFDERGELSEWVGVHSDITDLKRAESLHAGQRDVLEMVAVDAPLPDVLVAVCRVIEEQEPDLFCSLVLPDKHGHTGLAVGASLPASFLRALEGLRIDPPNVGTCAEALHTGRVVVATDVEADKRVSPECRALLLGHGLRASRSVPVCDPCGTVLASFAFYRRELGDPEPANKQLVQVASSLTRIAIQRHQAQQALRSSEERFRTLFESMDDGFCVVEMAFNDDGRAIDYRIMEMNPAFAKHTGMSGLVGKSIRQALPDLEEFWFETYGRVAATGESNRFVHAAGPMDGRWFNVNAFRLGGAGSNKVAILFNDITESRRVQDTLRESEARHAFVVTLADALRPLSDPTTVQAEASRVLGERLGANRVAYFEVRGDNYVVARDYTVAAPSIAGCHPIMSFGPELLAVFRSGRTASEMDVNGLSALTPEEQAVYAALQIRSYIGIPLIKGGALVAGLAIHAHSVRAWTPTEIGFAEETAERTWAAVERVRAEAALRASEERRRLALDAAELGTWHVDVDTRVTKTDARFRAIFGTTEEWTDYLQLFSVMHPDDRPAVEQAVAAATRRDHPEPYAIEYRVIHPDAGVRWVLAKGGINNEETAGREFRSFNGTVLDITERKRLEQERERLVVELRDADRRKDDFLATLAHELRNPLAPLRNGLALIQLAGSTGPVEKARSMMERQLTQLVRLVDDLMDVSRMTSGKLELRKERVDLRAVIDAAVETSQPAMTQAGHGLSVIFPDEPILVEADAARLAQVVSNLLNNAAKYTHRSGHVTLSVEREGDTAVVSVKDNGVGIPPAMLGRVFEMFTQVDRALEKTTGGLGIGLSLVKGLMEMHGGTVEAMSDGEGCGSEFVIRLPLAVSVIAERDRPNGQISELAPSARRRILVVDDNVDAADSLCQLLKMLGHDVKTANDGESGIGMAAQFRPDVVLMDIGMPKLNGYEAARSIRQHPWGLGMVLVALTGWGQEDDLMKSADAGFDHHFVKPVDMTVLTKLLAGLSIGD